MSKEKYISELMIKIAQKGLIGRDPMQEAEKIVAAIPPATRGNYPEDMLEAALAFADTYYSSMDTNTAPAAGSFNPNEMMPVAPSAEAKPAAFNTQQMKAISERLKSDIAAKNDRTMKTTIEKVLLDKPVPSSYIPADTRVVPTCRADKLAEYEKSLVDTPENIAAFNEVKAAVLNGTPMPVYLNDKNIKTIGYAISTPSSDAGAEQMVTRLMTPQKLMGFVALELAGYIPSPTADGLGCKLSLSKPRQKKGAKASVTTTEGTPRLRVVGRAEALKDEAHHDVTSQVVASEKPRKGKLRIAKSFIIDTGKRTDEGKAILRTVRLSGDYDLPVFERKTAAYKQAFPIGDIRSGIAVPTADEAKKLQEDQVRAAAFLLAKGGDAIVDYGLEKLADAIANDNATGADNIAI